MKPQEPESKIKILVVEDETILALHLRSMLLSLGYGVPAILASGEETPKRVAADRPDWVLMDIKLAGAMSGIDTAGLLHSRFDLPVGYLSANFDEQTLQRAKTAEPFGYVLKPFEERDAHGA